MVILVSNSVTGPMGGSLWATVRRFLRKDGEYNLANLPPDIIRRIIRLDGISTGSLREVSDFYFPNDSNSCFVLSDHSSHSQIGAKMQTS